MELNLISGIICCVITIFGLIYFYITNRYNYWKQKNIQYAVPTFPMGNLQEIDKFHLSVVIKRIYDKFVGKYLLIGIYFLIRPVALIFDPELIKTILVRDFVNFHDHGLYFNEKDPLSCNLFALEGQKWKKLRSKLTPTFTSGKMKMMFETLLNVADELKAHLKKSADTGEYIEIKDILARFTTDVIGNCAFGIDCNSIKDPNAEFRRNGYKIFNPSMMQQMLGFFATCFPDLSRKIGIKMINPDVTKFFMKIVNETLEYRKNSNVQRKDFMQLLLDMSDENKLTIEEIAAQAFLFFLAGFETSSTTMAFCLYELGGNLEIQQKVRNEIEKVLRKYDGCLTYDAILEMPYLDKVINETLRKYPAADSLIRLVSQDYIIPNTKYKLDKGTLVMIPVYSIQHDPTYYPDPEKFDPERFSEENLSTRHPFTYLPFGEGPRICIGMRFGMMQTRLGLASILKNYTVSHCEKTPKVVEFTAGTPIVQMKGGIWLKIKNI